MNYNIRKFLSIAFCALAISLALSFAILAWTEPAQAPAAANAAGPLNTGGVAQTKAGDLGIKIASGITYWISQIGNSLVFKTGDDSATASPTMIIGQDGHVGIGTTTPADGMTLDVAGSFKADEFCLDECCDTWENCFKN